MGITARGAWEAVKRHFREMDNDIQNETFTVAGVGDMSGDVFGNGMLLSPCIRLVGGLRPSRHLHRSDRPIRRTSFAERERLFALPRSSWQDYDKTLISKGGGVFSRTEKQIPLSPEMRKLLRLEEVRRAAGGSDVGDPPGARRSPVVRRHRHLCPRRRRERSRGRRQGQRCDPDHRGGDRREGGRRGRQSRHDAARAHRLRAARRPLQFRRDRQFRRRQHVRRRGEHQDRAGAGGARGNASTTPNRNTLLQDR